MATENMPRTTGVGSPPSGEEAILAALERIEERLDRLERRAARAEEMAAQAPAALAALTDSADEIIADAQRRGIDVDERLRAGVSLLERLTDPATMEALGQLCTLAEQAPGTVAMIGDIVDERFERMAESGIDVDERMRGALKLLERLTSPENLETLNELLERMDAFRNFLTSGVLDPGPLTLVGKAGSAFAEVARSDGGSVGAWGALRALSNEDVKHAIGLAVRFAERLGHELRSGELREQLPSKTNGEGARE